MALGIVRGRAEDASRTGGLEGASRNQLGVIPVTPPLTGFPLRSRMHVASWRTENHCKDGQPSSIYETSRSFATVFDLIASWCGRHCQAAALLSSSPLWLKGTT